MVDRVDINRLLVEMRAMKAQTQAFDPQAIRPNDLDVAPVRSADGVSRVAPSSETPSFTDLMSQAVDQVNGLQKQSGALKTAQELGDPNVDITDVMIASEKASVAFQATLQVRNKVVEAYRDVMNMPI